MIKKALIGYTGFVGSNLMRQTQFDDLYRSTNSHEMRGKSYDVVVCCGAPAEKWKANKEPERDYEAIKGLIDNLRQLHTSRFILISTVDVYSQPRDVDEKTPIDAAEAQPYGRHRYQLEEFVKRNFHNHLIIRLPGLFGRGLKKNIIYDFLNDNALDKVHADAHYQFYNLDHLWSDIRKAGEKGIRLLNITSEPISVREVSEECFGKEFENKPTPEAPFYAIRSRYAEQFGGRNGYLYSKEDVLREMKHFVASAVKALR